MNTLHIVDKKEILNNSFYERLITFLPTLKANSETQAFGEMFVEVILIRGPHNIIGAGFEKEESVKIIANFLKNVFENEEFYSFERLPQYDNDCFCCEFCLKKALENTRDYLRF